MKYALFIGADRAVKAVECEGPMFELPQLYKLLGCEMIERIDLVENQIDMIIDEEGKFTGKPANVLATLLFWTLHNTRQDFIVGDVLIVGVERGNWVGLFDPAQAPDPIHAQQSPVDLLVR